MTQRIRLLLFALAAGAVLASPTAAFGQTKLIANVGQNDGFTISLANEAGARVTDIPAGTYEIEVRDHSMHHNFHLQGAGVNQSTDVEFVGTVTWTVTLQDRQRYRYVCDPHAGQMNGSFTTGGGPPTPPPPPPPPPVQRLTATVGPASTISLRSANGRRVTRLKCGSLSDRRARSVDQAQLPPDRTAREPQDDHAFPWDPDLDADASEGELPLRLRPAKRGL